MDIGGLDYSAIWYPPQAGASPSAPEPPGPHNVRGAYSNASANGVPIAICSITNDTTGYAQLLARIFDHAPGPRLVVSIEGTRS